MQTPSKREVARRLSYGMLSSLVLVCLLSKTESALAFGSCDKIPSAQAVRRAQLYYDANRNHIEHSSNYSRAGSPGRKIVVNDYTQTPPQMFVMDPAKTDKMGDPVCLFNFPVDFGEGGGPTPRPGCGREENMTPPGFHITVDNTDGDRYPAPCGMGLRSCEGQESLTRGVKVHGNKSGKNCSEGKGSHRGFGRGVTWGCPALTDENYQRFLDEVRGGSLVYNYFGALEENPQNCKQPIAKSPKCTPEAAGASNGSSSRSNRNAQ